MYIQKFILAKAAFCLEGIQLFSLTIKREELTQDRYFDETNRKSGKLVNIASNFWTRH